MYTVGTAGHVDHGKSTLVKALTGIDPDRLPEEKEREMTIDLGFAHLTLPNGQHVSIVDVPGHERFIKNMLAGVGGIDLALLVIAADEGVMPQTREHLAILDLLQVQHGLVALTKRDLVEPDWLALVSDEIAETLQGTALENAQILPVSSTSGEGLQELTRAMAELLSQVPERRDLDQPRLPVDRVFTLAGFGTVVTGTLIDGSLRLGEEVEILPQRKRSRVRGLQTHNRKVELAPPGGRTAVNLAGLTLEDVRRGNVVARPGQLKPTRAVDVKLRLIPEALRGLENNDEVDLFAGAAEALARVTLLEGKQLRPGEHGWVRLRLQEPLPLAKGDKFIVRLPSPSATIGGGEVVDTAPRLHHRFRAQTLAWLQSLEAGSPEQILLQTMPGDQPIERTLALKRSGLSPDQAEESLRTLIDSDQALELDSHLISASAWSALTIRLERDLHDYHHRFPLRPGMPKEELKSRLGLPLKLFNAALGEWARAGRIAERGALVAAAGFQLKLAPDTQRKLDRALELMRQKPYSPPAETELGLNPEELALLLGRGTLTRVSDNVLFDSAAYQRMLDGTVEHVSKQGKITLAEFRDLWDTSRKYAQAFLEHLDERKITRRVGDERVLGPAARRSA
ncbi:MAG TPA: selenocysteine-specific translation elongation factor [Chloroflexota bacterium]|nr:selenocysteine-specific translation elongation factor [Chloroflexota bacterium]